MIKDSGRVIPAKALLVSVCTSVALSVGCGGASTAIVPTRAGTPWPGKNVEGYLNAINLCACPTNDPSSCSPY